MTRPLPLNLCKGLVAALLLAAAPGAFGDGWVQKLPQGDAGSPSAREGHAMVWDGTRVVLFGGMGPLNDLWWYDPATNAWTQKIANGAAGSPPARFYHTLVWDGTRVILFGGSAPGNTFFNDLWWYDPATNAWTQKIADGAAGSPAARTTPHMVWDGTRVILACGNALSGGAGFAQNDVWWYDPATNAWTEKIAHGTAGSPPPRAESHLAWNGTHAVLFGGVGNSGGFIYYNDLWWYDPVTNTWMQKIAQGTPGSPAAPHDYGGMVWDGARCVLFGGNAVGASWWNDLWWYDPSTNTWTERIPNGTPGSPPARNSLSFVWDGTRAILFGGAGAATYNDTWWYSPDPWVQKIPQGTAGSPSARETPQMVWDGTRVILFGGDDAHTAPPWSNDLWWYDPSANTWTLKIVDGAAGSPAGRLYGSAVWDGSRLILFGGSTSGSTLLNDLWWYNPATNTWTEKIVNGAPGSPPVRHTHSMVWDGTRLILFGGINGTGGYWNDLWWYDPGTNTWTQKIADSTAGSPPSRSEAQMTWDGSRVVLFGGAGNSGGWIYYNDLWWYDPGTNAWTQKLAQGAAGSPPSHNYGGWIWNGTRCILFGGSASGSWTNDLWWYEPGANTWSAQIANGDPASPAQRNTQGFVWDGTRGIMFAGAGASYYNDTWWYTGSGADITAPAVGAVNDGSGVDIDIQSSTSTISANWSGFADSQSGITGYEWAIGTTPGGTDVQPFTSVGTATSATNSTLSLGDLRTGSWTVVGNMSTPRWGHTNTVLSSGKVLITGGIPSFSASAATSTCEVFDPSNNSFTTVASMNVSKFRHAAVLLPDGKVLVAGGQNASNQYVNSCEIYDPVANSWTPTGNLTETSSNHILVLLNTGKVLLAGASGGATCQLFNPATGTWSNTGSLNNSGHQFGGWSVLNDGKVLVAGGYLSSAVEVYDPVAGTWTHVGSLQLARTSLGAATLLDGTVRILGGNTIGAQTAVNDVYTPGGSVSSSGAQFITARSHFGTIRTEDGRIVAISGQTGGGTTNTCEIFDPATGIWNAGPPVNFGRTYEPIFGYRPVRTAGRLFVIGGYNDDGTVHASVESIPEAAIYYVTVRATNGAGLTATATSDGVRIGSAAADPVITSPSTGAVTGATPTMTGTATAGATVTILDGATSLGTTVADSFGAWTFVTPTLSEGSHSLTARVGAGTPSGAVTVTVDATVPAVTTTTLTDGTIGSLYRLTLAATDATTIVWSLLTGSLPTGLTLGLDGVISGTPTASGAASFTVRATDAAGNTTDQALSITVATPAAPSVTGLEASDARGVAPLPVTFTGTATSGAPIVSAVWEFGDGTRFATDSVTGVQHAYEVAGTYTITLTVTDSLGQTATRTTTVVVTAPPGAPTVGVGATPVSGAAPLSVAFTGTATTSTGAFIGYEWDFDGDGVVDFSSATSLTANHVYTEAGTFTASFKAIRSDGTAEAATVQVVVGVPAGVPPSIAAGPTATPNPAGIGVPVAFTATGTVGAGAAGATIQYAWDFDGDGIFDLIEESGTSGTASTPSFIYDVPGTHTATVRVLDFQAGGDPRLSAEGTVSVTVNPPTAVRVFIVQPKEGDSISGNHVTVNLNAVPASQIDFTTASLQFRPAGSSTFTTASTTSEGSAPPSARLAWDLSATGDNLSAGSYELRAVVRDTLGTQYASDDPGQQGVVTVDVAAAGDADENKDANGRVRRDRRFDRGNGISTLKAGGQDYELILPPLGIDIASGTMTIEELSGNPIGEFTNLFNLTFHEIGLPAGSTLQQPAIIEITYADENGDGVVDGAGVRTDGLRILHFNAARGAWDTLPGQTHDTARHRVIGRTFSLSPVVLSGSSGSSSRSGGGGGGLCFLAPILPAPLWPFAAGLAAAGLFLARRRR